MNRWNIPDWLDDEISKWDKACAYYGIDFSQPAQTHGAKPSWEHIINNAQIISSENVARCCISCNAGKGAKDLVSWLQSNFCKRKPSTSRLFPEMSTLLYPAPMAGKRIIPGSCGPGCAGPA